MLNHLSDQQIELYRERKMTPKQLLDLDDHITMCKACRKHLLGEEKLRAEFTSLMAELQEAASAKPDHLYYKQLNGFIEGELDRVDYEMVATHLDLCAHCKADESNLRAIKAGTKISSWKPIVRWMPLYAAGIAAVVMLSAWAATLSLKKEVADLNRQLSHLQQRDEAFQKQASVITDLQNRLVQLQQEKESIQQNYEITRNATESKPPLSHKVLFTINDGGKRIALDRQDNILGLEALPPNFQKTAQRVLKMQQIDRPNILAELGSRPGKIMGGTDERADFKLLSPIGTVVLPDRPTLRWRPLIGAKGYSVSVYDSDYNRVANSEFLSGTEWTILHPLERNRVYNWVVTALKEERADTRAPLPSEPEAKFKVLKKSEADRLSLAKQRYPNLHLLLGTLYAQAGLLEDAEQEFQALFDANPKSPVAQRLLRSIKAMREVR
jgi:hypothetical protein